MNWALKDVVSDVDIAKVAQIADEVWHEHYGELLGKAQVEYMVEMFQSVPAMKKQIAEDGYRYYMILLDGEPMGYTAVQPQGEKLFLSKLYLLAKARGKGLAGRTVSYLAEQCRKEGKTAIWLTVNKYNSGSIAVYKHLGFETIREQVADIGQGYVMDDYVMEKQV
ncbi:MAG: GNAT family N-acetyltransferase [Clostridiales bacterium]|nr:GNAT family N-acetyltransferase [Clostridiales bacterium]